ncbi:RagB/SusD family nutrient uptake outer membrane protein [Moheibacter stercoris]|uniref:RagB/SusD domain-containing protein n=1 Tax=Moheibacter stercoris TaxID=1628251 RepID=A0ABV2LQ54_9FLAO
MKNQIIHIEKKHIHFVFFLIFSTFSFVSCDEFLEVDPPIGQVESKTVFANENTAIAAVTSLYSNLREETFLTGSFGLSMMLGYYTDEFDYYYFSGEPMEAFYRHQIIASNKLLSQIWNSPYHLIFMCNSVIEGLENSTHISEEIKNQLKGEALFIRALTHFYLVNLFGDIPYITSTDYSENQNAFRSNQDEVYGQIIEDLIASKTILSEEYASHDRTRANRAVASALLARVYLYTGQWIEAEAESSSIINNLFHYVLEPEIQNEFLKNSSSTILQLAPSKEGENTKEGNIFLFEFGPPFYLSLNEEYVQSFDILDLRKHFWIKEIIEGEQIWYTPYKYKQSENTGTSMEYSIAFRLSEQILIRAEARVHLGDLSGCKNDINLIRERAGLPHTTATSPNELIDAILNERKFEFFAEHGHRWFDLKRLNQAENILSPIKSNWRSTDILFPIPESELLLNPNLTPQNPGY